MAVHVLRHSELRTADAETSVPVAVLALALVPAALDLLTLVQPALESLLAVPMLAALGLAAAALVGTWLRFPRAAWLLAAGFSALAALALQWVGADVAPVLTLLSLVALGVGGAFDGGAEVNPASV